MAYNIFHVVTNTSESNPENMLRIARVEPGGTPYDKSVDGGHVSFKCDEEGNGSVVTSEINTDGECEIVVDECTTPVGPGDDVVTYDGAGNTLRVKHVDTADMSSAFGKIGGVVLLSSN